MRLLSTISNIQPIRLRLSREKTTKSRVKIAKGREKIVALLSEDGKLSAAALAEKIGISA
jgi:predicted HTH transcriptional regulator